ncbi:hypothetical protein CEXT_711461 [Caerostris extrusa]|uniref:DDE Tnp4 domain-containing protein n=1 Tax=Caerostris extrusa TaxID=172846 RepID=A0AAV4QXM7_CAEEX|nr:hypothetical protein CEXT_711461 [Caerostris extrusa]
MVPWMRRKTEVTDHYRRLVLGWATLVTERDLCGNTVRNRNFRLLIVTSPVSGQNQRIIVDATPVLASPEPPSIAFRQKERNKFASFAAALKTRTPHLLHVLIPASRTDST